MSSAEENQPTEASDANKPGCCEEQIRALRESAEQYIRQEPIKSTAGAFVAGVLMTMLPLGAIAGGLVRLAMSLLRPALLLLGVMKVVEEVEKRRQR
jgi:hypothetical protein